MALLIITCPHCRTPRSPFASVAFRPREGDHQIVGFFLCPVCDKPIGGWLNRMHAVHGAANCADLQNWPQTIEKGGWRLTNVWPTEQETEAPADVPPAIARNFIQAEEAAVRGHRESAGMTYRRVLELTLKDKAPEQKGTLEKRIDKLAADNRLTPEIATWAHSIRDLGNESAHDEAEPTADDIKDLAAFTRIVLEYLYTMPAKVNERAGVPLPVPIEGD